jgi:hypothetical protein
METTVVDRILLDHLENPLSLFVFPTDIAVNRWADRVLRLRGGGSIAMEQFIAWDRFKNASIRSRMQDKRSVPSILRRIFVSRLLEENAARIRDRGENEGIFRSLIPPVYAQGASSFSSWLAAMLPQLGNWFESVSGKPVAEISAGISDPEDPGGTGIFEGDERDLFSLTLRYKEFLDHYKLFEPAWEKPPFDDNGRECFIFFPESLSDFSEYESLLKAAPQVRILRLQDTGGGEKSCRTFYYTNARSEITEAALYIRNLVDREGIAWEDIAVSLPEGENYEPYAMREFANRSIPVVRRAGKALSDYPAGQLFTGIQDCCVQGFPFARVSNLLLNSHLPWKNQVLIDQLIDFGIRNNCICSWTEDGRREDVWLDAFNSLAGSREQRARGYYQELTSALEKIHGARNFRELVRAYFTFRDRFLDSSQCSAETDAVLSRCVSELLSLVEIEDSFPDLSAPDPYGFFIEHLKETSYLAQEKTQGVSILPYRTAAPVPFDCHIVLGSSQENLSMIFSRFTFLPRVKKERLGLGDIDASDAFITFHRLNSTMPAAFFCSGQSFSGFAIPHSSLGIEGEPRLRCAETGDGLFAPDLFDAEESALREPGMGGAAPELHHVQVRGFHAWRERREGVAFSTIVPGGLSGPGIAELLEKKRGGGKVRVSASSLEPYYYCSAKWFYERILRLESRRMETALMAENVTGSLYHAVLDRFFKALTEEGGMLAFPGGGAAGRMVSPGVEQGVLSPGCRRLLSASIREIFDALPLLPGERIPLSALTSRFLRAQERVVQGQLELLLGALLGYLGGCRVLGSEIGYEVEKQDYFLTGKVDLLLSDEQEESESPRGVIVDFKLNRLPDRKSCVEEGELGNFQLPMYVTLAESSGGDPVGTALFFSILKTDAAVIFGRIRDRFSGKQKPGRQAVIRGDGGGRFDAIMAEFLAKAEAYAHDIGRGDLAAPHGGEEHCGGCAYRRVCRTLYTVAGDRSLRAGEVTEPVYG